MKKVGFRYHILWPGRGLLGPSDVIEVSDKRAESLSRLSAIHIIDEEGDDEKTTTGESGQKETDNTDGKKTNGDSGKKPRQGRGKKQ